MRNRLLLTLVLCLPALAEASPRKKPPANAAPPASPPIDLARARVVDLSHRFDEQTLFWPTGTESFKLTKVHHGPTPGGYFYAANTFSLPEHGGTHIDAPLHFAEHGRPVDTIPLRQLIAPAVVIDVTRQAAQDPDYRLDVETVRAFEAAHGRIAPGTIVLLRTGWSARYPDRKRYFGDDRPGDATHLHFPSYGEAAAHLLVEERQVAALGVDTASIDHGPSQDFMVHRIAAAANVPGLENLTGLEALPARGAWVIALPIKLGGGSGGPTRVIALLP